MEEYIYEVARIRAKELQILPGTFYEQMIAAQDENACIKMLEERGWSSDKETAEEMLSDESKKSWDLMRELLPDTSVFDVFLYEGDYHNLKAAIKQSDIKTKRDDIFRTDSTISTEIIRQAVDERDFSLLPERMQEIAEKAENIYLQTHDGLVVDTIIDRAALVDIYKASKESKEDILKLYGELTVVAADIKIAVRANRTGKDRAFYDRALAACETLDIEQLKEAALESSSAAIGSYLKKTDYSDAVLELKKSPAAFERWCDNLMIRSIRPQIYNCMGLGPLAAYILARNTEIKTVRIILSAKRNALDDDVIRERVREAYV